MPSLHRIADRLRRTGTGTGTLHIPGSVPIALPMLRHDRAWRFILVFGFVALAVGTAVGGTVQALVALALASSPIVSGQIAVSRQPAETKRPWRYFVWAGSGFLVATVVREGLVATGSFDRFPSPADGIVAISYLLLITAIYLFGSIRSAGRNAPAQVDGLIVAVAAATAVWALVLVPYMSDASVPLSARLLNAVLAMLTTLALATTTRLAVSPGARTTGYYLLALAVAALFVNDLLATLASVEGAQARLSILLNPTTGILFSAAALHPDSPKLLEPPSSQVLQLTKRRMTLLAAAILVVPALITLSVATGREMNPSLLIVSSFITAVLVLVRIKMLVTVQERAVEVQRIQREANADLAAASSRHAMQRAGLKAAMRLIGGTEVRVAFAQVVEHDLRIVDAVGSQATDAIGTSISLDRVPNQAARSLADRIPVRVDETEPIDLGPSSVTAGGVVSLFLAPLAAQNALSGALVITTKRALPLTVLQSLETLASTLSLALESAALTEDLLRRRSERRFRALVDNSSDIVLVINEEGLITFASPASHRLLGLTEQAILGSHPARWLHAEDWPILAGVLDDSTPGTDSKNDTLEVRFQHVDGTYRWFELRSQDLTSDPEIEGIVVTAREVTDRKATEELLATSEARFRALVQNSSDVVAVVDASGRYAYISPAVTDMLGYTPDELEGETVASLVDPADRGALAASYPGLLPDEIPDTPFAIRRFEAQVRHKSGEYRTLDVGVADMRNEPAIAGIVLNARDVTVRKSLERDLRHQAMHDALTGLPNRTMFTDRAEAALRVRGTSGLVAALFIDLDDFKTVNDSLGHAAGDQLLREVATRLEAHLTGAEISARLGGDEFAVLVTDASNARQAHETAQEIIELVAQPFLINEREIRVTCSVGIALASGQKRVDSKVLLSSADVAMYVAKDRGKNCAAVFEEHLHASVFERLEMKADLNRAVEDGQLICLYQPIVSLQTGRVSGVEALVRWDHPTRGRLGPDAFIPLAEDTGIVIALGRSVLRQACQQLRTWQDELPDDASLTLSVNLSVRQLDHGNIVADVREAIEESGIDASTLTLEITETSLMHDTEVTRHRLAQLRELGVSLAVDDFGTGYSSLQYVQRFPIDVLKIDRTFVSGLGSSAGDNAVVQSMIELAQRLGVHAVAEGIETPEQLALLRSLGADLGQGFLFSEPVPAADIDALVLTQPADQPHFSLN